MLNWISGASQRHLPLSHIQQLLLSWDNYLNNLEYLQFTPGQERRNKIAHRVYSPGLEEREKINYIGLLAGWQL